MKNLISILAISLIIFTSCTGVKTVTQGLENESYLEIVGKPSSYLGGVEVKIDEKITFKAQVSNGNTASVKGKVYAISTGKHNVIITYKDNTILQKQIFISAQETKKLLLP